MIRLYEKLIIRMALKRAESLAKRRYSRTLGQTIDCLKWLLENA